MNVKKQRLAKGGYMMRGGEDRISELPDCLLHHILSLLPIEQAVGTSILSTRWRYLWTSIPVLSFTANDRPVMKFVNFVDEVMRLHDMNIHKFSLEFFRDVDEYSRARVIAWVSNLIRHGVQELKLILDLKQPFVFPPNLLTCESLVKLSLDIDNCIFKLPNSACFSRLNILHLESMTFSDDYSSQQLFSNCPVLEELVFFNCRWENMNFFRISGPALKRLTVSVSTGLRNTVLELYAPNLVYLKYECCLPKDFILSDFPSLTYAYICLEYTEIGDRSFEELSYCASKFLGRLSNVKVLEIWGTTFDEFFCNTKDLFTRLPTFNNLNSLEVSSGVYCPNGRTLLDLLQISPNLEYLVFAEVFTVDEIELWTYEEVPQCLLSHLKKVKFMCFRPHELYVLKYLLKKAKVLERMDIFYSLNLSSNPKEKLKIEKQILMLPRCTINSVINFSNAFYSYL